jgi:hypothetical protein
MSAYNKKFGSFNLYKCKLSIKKRDLIRNKEQFSTWIASGKIYEARRNCPRGRLQSGYRCRRAQWRLKSAKIGSSPFEMESVFAIILLAMFGNKEHAKKKE